MAVDVILAGLVKTMKTLFRAGEHIPYHISQAPEDEVTLLTNAAVTGTAQDWPGGQGMWTAYGTFDGVTAQLQVSPDAGMTWIDISGALLTADGGFPFLVPAYKIRTKITGAGDTNTSVTSKAKQC